eukprot:TRINITY_DN70_c0_g1_i4.p1 TRINITY_DN70_c0_g1~~TRINITY_DN70_c0_g1_i4.p1  ORF type:complete len:563 (-),score=249.63 TRINITY_DN70_c0_g1_i4:223-1911(-)
MNIIKKKEKTTGFDEKAVLENETVKQVLPLEKVAEEEKKDEGKKSPKDVALEWAKSRVLWNSFLIVFVSWFFGYFGFSFAWSLWLIPLCLAWNNVAVKRLLRRKETQVQQDIARNRQIYPQYESVEWVNRMIEHCWLTYGSFIASKIEEGTKDALKDTKLPPPIVKMLLEDVNMGQFAPRCDYVQVHETKEDQIRFDLQLRFDSNMKMFFNIYAKMSPKPVQIAIKDFFMTGRLQMTVDLLPGPPFAQQLSFTFLGVPDLDITVKPLSSFGPDIMSIPGLADNIHSFALEQIKEKLVYPAVMTIPLNKDGEKEEVDNFENLNKEINNNNENEDEGIIGSGFNTVKNVGEGSLNAVKNVGEGSVNAVKNVGEGSVNAVKNVGEGSFNAVKNVGEGSVNAVFSASEEGINTFKNVGEGSVNAVFNVGEEGINTFKNLTPFGHKKKKRHSDENLDETKEEKDNEVSSFKNKFKAPKNIIKRDSKLNNSKEIKAEDNEEKVEEEEEESFLDNVINTPKNVGEGVKNISEGGLNTIKNINPFGKHEKKKKKKEKKDKKEKKKKSHIF